MAYAGGTTVGAEVVMVTGGGERECQHLRAGEFPSWLSLPPSVSTIVKGRTWLLAPLWETVGSVGPIADSTPEKRPIGTVLEAA